MPLYDFFCNDCKQSFEELCAAASVPTCPPCPHCASPNTEQRMSAPSPTLTNPFPYTVGGVHPLGKKMAAGITGTGGTGRAGGAGGCPAAGTCGGSGGFSCPK